MRTSGGIVPTRGPRSPVVACVQIGSTRHGPRWRVTLACGHVREITDGTECRPDARGSWRIGDTWYKVPTMLGCLERVNDTWCSGAQKCSECRVGKRRPAVSNGLCALHASRARKAACTS